MARRLVVFFDWQNIYMRARDAFGYDPNVAPQRGQVDPAELATLLLERHRSRNPDDEFELYQVRVYRGRPTAANDQRGYDAFQRQTARWAQNNKVVARYRDLRYPLDWGTDECVDKPREKGVDVALAVDLVTMAAAGEYDDAIVMSADFDLVPAVDFVVGRRLVDPSRPSLAVAAWESPISERPLRIRLQGKPLWCYWLSQEDYWGVEDTRDYREPAPLRESPVPRPGSWLHK